MSGLTNPFDLILGTPDEETAARGRLTGKSYASKPFPNSNARSRDHGQPSRFTYKVLDGETTHELTREGEEWFVTDIAGGRTQVKVLVSREAGNIVDLWIQKVPATGKVVNVLHLRRDDARRLADFIRYTEELEPSGRDTGIRIDDSLISDVLADPSNSATLYRNHPQVMRSLIESDETGHDVVAIAARRAAVARFRTLLHDDVEFDRAAESAGGQEAVWQKFFELNPWVLGIGLGNQLMTSYSSDRLERVVTGYSVAGPGKRVDALLRTSGAIKSMVFAEIKHHRTPLLDRQYRSGAFYPSTELAGGIAQIQNTVQRAISTLGRRLQFKDADGTDIPADYTYLLQPRSFLVIGNLTEFVAESGGHHEDRFMSFELLRRNTTSPEIVTFDELLARAEWIAASSD